MNDTPHTIVQNGRVITLSWVGDAEVTPSRVYALAFTPEGSMLLVSGAPIDGCCFTPGGGIEADETPEVALQRELMEEAAATIHALKRIGFQRADDPLKGAEYHAFYWCRITLADASVPTELDRFLVQPEAFLDSLAWGRTDPKAGPLLDRALELERHFKRSETSP